MQLPLPIPSEGLPPHGPPITRTALDDAPVEYRSQIEIAQLDGLAPTEAWTVEGTNRQNAYSTHGMFRYFGKYPPPIGRDLIATYTEAGDRVVDPTCGSGTTGVEAVLAGRCVIQYDVNPVALAVARAKTTHVPDAEGRAALNEVIASYTPASTDEHDLGPVGLRNPDHWFLPETGDSLRGLDRATNQLDPGAARDLLRIAYLATIRRCSRATTQQGRLFLDADSARLDGLETFVRAARRAIGAAADFPPCEPVPCHLHDSREPIPAQDGDRPSLVILHPPYFNAYKYSRVNSLELAWTGVNPADVRKREIREFFKIGKPENATRYVDDMALVLSNAVDLAAPGGAVAVMIGDTRLKGEHIPVTRWLLDRLLPDHPCSLEKLILRIPRHTEASWVASQRRRADQLGIPLCDYIFVLRRDP